MLLGSKRSKGWDKPCVKYLHLDLDRSLPSLSSVHLWYAHLLPEQLLLAAGFTRVPQVLLGGRTAARRGCKAQYTWKRKWGASTRRETGDGNRALLWGKVWSSGKQKNKRSCFLLLDLGVNGRFQLSSWWLCWVRTTATCLSHLQQAAVYTLTLQYSTLASCGACLGSAITLLLL